MYAEWGNRMSTDNSIKSKVLGEKILPFQVKEDDFYFLGGHVFSYNGRNLLLNRENGTTIFLDDELLTDLKEKCLSDDLQFKLIQRGFAKTSDSPSFCDATDTIMPTFFIIDLTKSCNLRCSYCFRHLSNEEPTISEDELDKVCDYIISYCKKYKQERISIQPWGGEPLIAFQKIKRLQDRFSEAGINPHITVESNGTLITSEIAKELLDRNIQIGISIDGIPKVHNSQRKFLSGEDSFSKVYNGIENLKENGHRDNIGTITVITKNSIDYIEDILDYFSKELKLSSIKLNLVRESCTTYGEELALEPDEIVSFTKRLVKKVVELHKEGYCISEGNIAQKMNNLLMRENSNICIANGCMGGKKMVSINRKGQIFPCEMTDYIEESIGTINDDKDLVELVKDAVICKDYFTEKTSNSCKECPWWYYCRGGCTTGIKYINNGKVCGIDQKECIINNTMYPELIKIICEEPDIAESLIDNRVSILWRG